MRPLGGLVVAALLLVPGPASAQTPGQTGAVPGRFFIDVNFLGTAFSVADERQFQNSFIQSGEVTTFKVTYPKPTDARVFPLLDVGGGWMLNRHFGFGAQFSQAVYDDPAGLEATVPHPFYLQAAATAKGASDPLRRTENSLHLFITATALRTDRSEWRFSGGPSIISLSAEMVSEILYIQTATPESQQNTVTITGAATQTADGMTVGFHIASDFAYDITRAIAITGGVRASKGTVTINREPLTKIPQDIRVGGWRIFLGLRFRFGTLDSQ